MGETRLTFEAAALLTYLQASLLFVSPRTARHSLRAVELQRIRQSYSPETVVRAVERAAGRLKILDNCLAKALVARALLARSGYAAELKVGVVSGAPRFEAHAWLERDGVVILGGAESPAKYAPFLELERALV